ncbi:MAG TPA: TlpA disulfide reductase family protein [Burkholderiales bacterium]|nr:TlpA disulfide reductase family protein [Burkholderiales bacterium]
MPRLALAAALLIAAGAGAGGAAVAASLVGQKAPECALAPLGDSPPFDLAAARGAKVLYVDFWASWCGPCVRAFPFLNALDREFRDRGLQVVGINVDERADDALAFLRRYRANFPVAKDSGGACPRAFGVVGMPASYLIDRRGIVREVHIGFRDGEAAQRRAQVERLLAEPDPGPGGRAEGER